MFNSLFGLSVDFIDEVIICKMLLFLLLLLKMKFGYRMGEWTGSLCSGLGLFESPCEHGDEISVYTN
jgi:hypothetical protein